METAFWIIATIILCFVCAYQAKKANMYKKANEGAMKDYQDMVKITLEVENKLRKEIEEEKKETSALRKYLKEQDEAMALLQRTKFSK